MRAFSKVYGVLAVVGLLASGGCLRKELRHTLYLSPSGVVWSSIEQDVRSDHADMNVRLAEEQDYLLSAKADQHGIARALRAAGGTRVRTTILRAERPFTVVTDAHFGDLASMAVAMIRAARVRGDATIERDGCKRTFRAWATPDESLSDENNPMTELTADALSYRLVLTEGRFLEASGFTIEEDGSVATPGAADVEDGTIRVSLSWMEGGCVPQLH